MRLVSRGNNMRRIIFLVILIVSSYLYASIIPSKPIPPIIFGDIQYSAPNDRIGCIEAKSIKTGITYWWKQVYIVKFDVKLEEDVQWCFINKITIKDNNLTIVNDLNYIYELNLESLAIKVIKGSYIIDRTKLNNRK